MADTLQELITRGRFVMVDAPSRLAVFNLVDGRSTARDIAVSTQRHINNVRRDLTVLRDAGLIQPRIRPEGPMTRDGFPVYEKLPLARTIPIKYFAQVEKRPEQVGPRAPRGARKSSRSSAQLAAPNENEILAIAKSGEDQLYEFKAPGTDAAKIAREIGAMLNTTLGGMVLYGIDDEGSILGTDMTRAQLDQRLQNSIKNMVSPAAVVRLHSVSVLGSDVIVIIVPPWNRQDVYQYNEKICIRKGTNVFGAKPEEVRALHRGEPVI